MIFTRATSGVCRAHVDMDGLDEDEGIDQEAASKHWQLCPDSTKFDAPSWSIP